MSPSISAVCCFPSIFLSRLKVMSLLAKDPNQRPRLEAAGWGEPARVVVHFGCFLLDSEPQKLGLSLSYWARYFFLGGKREVRQADVQKQ